MDDAADPRVTISDGVVCVTLHGVTDSRKSFASLAHALAAAHAANSTRILFDVRAAVHPNFHSDVLAHGARAPETGLSRFRIAILGRAEDPMLPFIEDVAANRAVPAKTFSDEAAALAWLRQR